MARPGLGTGYCGPQEEASPLPTRPCVGAARERGPERLPRSGLPSRRGWRRRQRGGGVANSGARAPPGKRLPAGQGDDGGGSPTRLADEEGGGRGGAALSPAAEEVPTAEGVVEGVLHKR
jgi:hypothetical protein